MAFIDSLYSNDAFLTHFSRLQSDVAYFGALSSLSQLVLKVTSPGIPDFYRGTEIWDLTLADPDNRRPLDFSLRAEMLGRLSNETSDLDALLEQCLDGRLKMYITYTLLSLRRRHSDLFLQGEYIPLRIKGAHANHVVAFARRHDRSWSIIAVPRLCGMLTEAGSPPLGKKIWKDTEISMPANAPVSWTDELTGKTVSRPVTAAALFETLPVAVLHSST
jgi:(1->4)-alpha-D-glucan 1-alpha-D-glucosylmutase